MNGKWGQVMIVKRNRNLILVAAAALSLTVAAVASAGGFPGGLPDALGPGFSAARVAQLKPRHHPDNALTRWNEIAINATGLDHTPVAPGENRVFGEQLGPARSARAMAIVHIAMFEAVNAIEPRYHSYVNLSRAPHNTSIDAAVAQGAHDTLAALFPSQKPSFDTLLADDLGRIHGKSRKANGIALGKQAAAAILALRADDGSEHPEPKMGVDFIPSNQPGKWRQDPISLGKLALGALWGECKPFVMQTGDQFRAPTPPALTSPEYTSAYDETKGVGGDGITIPTTRTEEQTQIGLFWAYDGTPSLCAPPRLYNQVTVHIADQMGTSSHLPEFARLLALVNVSLADAGIAVWESKYYYQYWRPVAAIRESDPGTGPTGLGDGNPNTAEDATFTPLGAPASNLMGPNFTPPFPAYPSGHAGFGGALFETLRNFYGTDNIPFVFVSDELNGVTRDNMGKVRPLVPRSFSSLSQAEEENGQSRIYLGIHWHFDKTEGIAQGRKVADWVFHNAFTPLHEKH
jgi:PAP2 superfamily